MAGKLRLDLERSMEISVARLSPRYGCGLMLRRLPRFDESDALLNIMEHYGYKFIYADKPAARIICDSQLLKKFYENAFENKTPIRRNFYQVFGSREVFLALDQKQKSAWFISDPLNKMELLNYYRDSVSLEVKALGIMLTGSTPRLTPLGWQNLYDLLTDEFFLRHPDVKQVEILSTIAGVRWRKPFLGLGVTLLNMKDALGVKIAVDAAFAGQNRENG